MKSVPDLQAIVAKFDRDRAGLKELYLLYRLAEQLPQLLAELGGYDGGWRAVAPVPRQAAAHAAQLACALRRLCACAACMGLRGLAAAPAGVKANTRRFCKLRRWTDWFRCRALARPATQASVAHDAQPDPRACRGSAAAWRDPNRSAARPAVACGAGGHGPGTVQATGTQEPLARLRGSLRWRPSGARGLSAAGAFTTARLGSPPACRDVPSGRARSGLGRCGAHAA